MTMFRRLPLAATAALVCLFGAPLSFASAAPVAGVHPAVARATGPFGLGPAKGLLGGITFTPAGSLVLAWYVSGTKTEICTIKVGARKCGHITYLKPPGGLTNTLSDTPLVFAPSASHIVMLQDTCCDTNTSGDDLFWSSSDGGK